MKRFLCVVLTLTLVLGMALSANAATIVITPGGGGPGPVLTNGGTGRTGGGVVTSGIRNINDSSAITDLIDANATLNDSDTLSFDDLTDLEVQPGDVIKIPLQGVLFKDSSGTPFDQFDVSLSALNSAGITVRGTFSQGQGVYNVSLGGNRNGSYIKIEFLSGHFFQAQRFSSYIFLYKNGSRKASTRIAIKGRLESVPQELYAGDDYVDLSDGSAAHVNTTLRNVEVYLGEGCSITRTLSKGQTYAGIATVDDINSNDLLVLSKYPNVEYIYKLETVGLKLPGNIVRFDLDRKYYVYNSNGTYIGTSDQALPYWTRYYMSSTKYPQLAIKIS